MNNDYLSTLLRIAWLEGLVNTRGAYEKAVARRTERVRVLPHERTGLIERLETALASRKEAAPLTVGALLKSVRSRRGLAPQEIFVRMGVTKNIYTLMEQDAISPLKIPAEAWQRLVILLNISVDEIAQIIRRTCRLIAYRPSFGGMLARYKGKKGGKKKITLENAYAELYARAEIPLPPADEKRLTALLSEMRLTSGEG